MGLHLSAYISRINTMHIFTFRCKFLTMKIAINTIILFLSFLSATAQEFPVGEYRNYFSSAFIFKADYTYMYSYHFDLSSSWSSGKWKYSNDTLYLTNIPIYDTLITYDTTYWDISSEPYSIKIDTSLVLSSDTIIGRIPSDIHVLNSISGGGQNRFTHPEILVFKKARLYELNENGSLKSKKVKRMFGNKRY